MSSGDVFKTPSAAFRSGAGASASSVYRGPENPAVKHLANGWWKDYKQFGTTNAECRGMNMSPATDFNRAFERLFLQIDTDFRVQLLKIT